MKKIIFGYVIVFFLIASVALAQETSQPKQAYREKKIVIVAEDEVIEGDYIAAGDVVEINGTVNGDVFAAGGQVTVNGLVRGDVLAAGGVVTIRGTVTNNVRLVGGQVLMQGTVDGNATLLGGTVNVGGGAGVGNVGGVPSRISGNLVAATGELQLDAPVTGNVTFAAGKAYVATAINGNVVSYVDELTVDPDTTIQGDVTYHSKQPAMISDISGIRGKIVQEIPEEASMNFNRDKFRKSINYFLLVMRVAATIALFMAGMVMIALLPEFSKKAGMTLQERPMLSFGVGFLSLILLPMFGVMMIATVVGIPLAVMLFLGFGVLIFVSHIVATLTAGYLAVRLFKSLGAVKGAEGLTTMWIFVLGLVVVFVLKLFPPLGLLLNVLFTVGGVGALLVAKKEMYQVLRKKNLI